MIKEAKGGDITTKCGKVVKTPAATLWWREVSCKECVLRLARSTGK